MVPITIMALKSFQNEAKKIQKKNPQLSHKYHRKYRKDSKKSSPEPFFPPLPFLLIFSFFIQKFLSSVSSTHALASPTPTASMFLPFSTQCQNTRPNTKKNPNGEAKEISRAHIIYKPHKNKRKAQMQFN